MYIAHSSPDGKKQPQSLEHHTNGVFERSVVYSCSFDPYGITPIAALAHDLGKMTKEFQAYIQSDNPKKGSVKHALGGTLVLNTVADIRAQLAGMIVAGHHAGLPDARNLYNEKVPNAESYLRNLPHITNKEKQKIQGVLQGYTPLPNLDNEPAYVDLLVKMCFSALVDADFLDTEEYMDENRSKKRHHDCSLTVEDLSEKLQQHMNQLMKQAKESPLNNRRAAIYQACIEEGASSIPFRSLNVPTGLGKTLSAMGYALEHAKQFNKKRVIVAIPFTSIIDQNAEVYTNVFGADSVLEHHSQTQDIADENEEMSPSRLATENWDRPIIVTTTVQLFESLFSNKTSKCRKLHNIVDSIIILDEFQKLPIGLLKPIFTVLKTLIQKFNVTVVVSSATPLSFDKRELLGNIDAPVEICSFNHQLFEEMKRVEYTFLEETLTVEILVNSMSESGQVLCIVNTKKDALKIYEKMKDSCKSWDKIYHLSTSMCPHHRKKVIAAIRADLEEEKSIAVVSTQLIEAGVDFDFPVVYRAMAPIDSIVQAAGRCNREGKLAKGDVYIFELEEGGMPPGIYTAGTEQARAILQEDGANSLHYLPAYNKYFRSLYSLQGEHALDELEITKLAPFTYAEVNKRFKMIDQDTISVLCRYYADEEASRKIEKLIEEAKYAPYLSKNWYRTAQTFSIGLYKNSSFLKENQQLLKPIADGWYVWEGRYNDTTGITDSLSYNPDELVV
ncbi:MAG: CRISPR-associated helicase Cas3' [Ectobacillus sp.]